MSYSKDFREKVLEVKNREKMGLKEASKLFGIGTATISRWRKEIEPKVKRNKAGTKIREEELRKDVESYADSYQYERAERLGVCQSAICYALKRIGISVKKKPIRIPKQTLSNGRVSKKR